MQGLVRLALVRSVRVGLLHVTKMAVNREGSLLLYYQVVYRLQWSVDRLPFGLAGLRLAASILAFDEADPVV